MREVIKGVIRGHQESSEVITVERPSKRTCCGR